MLGWGLVLGVVAIAGMPPLGIFMSEFLVVSSTFAREPLLAIVLVFGLLVGVRRAVAAAQGLRLWRTARPSGKAQASYVPMFSHLGLVLVAGLYLPPALVTWFQHVADCSDRPMPALIDIIRGQASRRSSAMAAPDRRRRTAGAALRRTRGGPRDAARPVGRSGASRCTWRCIEQDSNDIAVVSLDCPDETFPVGWRAAPAGDPARTRHA